MKNTSYIHAARRAWRYYSNTIFRNEIYFLDHLFFVIGSGYEWKDGALVYDLDDDVEDQSSYFIEHIKDRVPEISFEEWFKSKDGVEKHDWFECELQLYPLCKYSHAVNFPDNIKPDWKSALIRALNWAMNAPHDEKLNCEETDHMYIRYSLGKLTGAFVHKYYEE